MPCTYYTPAEERNIQLNSISELKDKVNKRLVNTVSSLTQYTSLKVLKYSLQ